MPADFATGGHQEKMKSLFGRVAFLRCEHPVSGTLGSEILPLDPITGFVGMTPLELSPERLENEEVSFRERFLGTTPTIEVGPTPQL